MEDWKYHLKHCQERALSRFNFALSMDAYFEMVNGRVPFELVGSVQDKRKKGRLKLRHYKNVPGVWLCKGKWPITVANEDMTETIAIHKNLLQLERRELSRPANRA